MWDIVQKISALVGAQAHLAGPFGFVVTFLGCMIGTSLVVPAGAIVTAIGVLMGAGVVSWSFILWAICGAALGMTGSYALGQIYGPRLLQSSLVQSRPQLVERVRRLFSRYGAAAILIGYYTGPPRAVVASIAAIAGMPRLRFECANILSAALWVTGAAAIGALPGTLIDPASPWLLAATMLMPVLTLALTVLLLRAVI